MFAAALLATTAARPTIVVTTPSGRVGSALIRALDARGVPIVVLARDAAKARASLTANIRVLEADYGDPDALEAAFASISGSTRVFLACGNSPTQATLECNLLDAAQRHNAEYVVKLSTASAVLEDERGGPYAAHLEVEAALAACGVAHTVLRPNLFFQMLVGGGLLGVALDENGACEHAFATAPTAAIDCRDVAAVAAALLACDDVAPHDGRVYSLTGPAPVTLADDLAKELARMRGGPVTITACSAEAQIRRAMPGLPPPVEASLVGFLEVLAERCRETTPHVEALSGRPPTSLATFVAEQRVRDFLAAG